MSDEPEIPVPSAPLSPADENLLEYFQDLERASLKTLEEAARQLITLVTALLGLFFGVMAFRDAPAYLASTAVQALGAAAVVFYVLTLFLALDVVMPRRFERPAADLTAMRAVLQRLFARKSRSLRGAQLAFALATLFLLALILALLFRAG